MAERSEAKKAKRQFFFWREASLRAFCFASLSHFLTKLSLFIIQLINIIILLAKHAPIDKLNLSIVKA